MLELTKQQKYTMDLKDIAKAVKQQLKKEYPTCVFSVVTERYSMGQSLHVSLMQNDFKIIRDFKDIPEVALLHIGTGYTEEQIKQRQEEKHHQLNQYTFNEEYDIDKWCNGVFLTKEGHDLFKRVGEIVNQYNYNDSDIQTDYFDVNFYLSLNIGKWDKPYILQGS